MNFKTRAQKGSLMVEMIAVIGLIALVTPILFQQIQRRNEEIVNAQIATEMRALKDAASALIQSDETGFAQIDCAGLWDGNAYTEDYGADTPVACNDYTIGDLAEFLPSGAVECDADGCQTIYDGEYDIYFYGYTVPTHYNTEGVPNEFRPVIYAVIGQNSGMRNLRRASKVAALIGLEGGVVVTENSKTQIHGMQGAWKLANVGFDENAVVVVTSFDDASNASILKDVRWQHLQSETAQAQTIVGDKVGINEVLSVGGDENCIANYKENNVTIQSSAENAACAPFFEVDPTTKEVKLAGVIKTGETTGATCTATTKAECERVANCVWVTKEETDENGVVVDKSECVGEYLLNPSETSMVEDIKLGSRGGARLSDILPNWILKETKYIKAGASAWNVDIPVCPAGYKPTITTYPTLTKPTPLKPDATNKFVTGTAATRVLISTSETLKEEAKNTVTPTTTDDWTIEPQRWETTAADAGAWTTDKTNISVLVHTYCVFVED